MPRKPPPYHTAARRAILILGFSYYRGTIVDTPPSPFADLTQPFVHSLSRIHTTNNAYHKLISLSHCVPDGQAFCYGGGQYGVCILVVVVVIIDLVLERICTLG